MDEISIGFPVVKQYRYMWYRMDYIHKKWDKCDSEEGYTKEHVLNKYPVF